MDIGKPETQKEIIVEPISEPGFIPREVPAEPVIAPTKVPVPA